ncbi:unnamed protein product [Rotaria socialis]|uniref:Uncharacterized protein n=2 Tax=Rotaria socialis TaxID=392032 RepID=A0A817QH00_9BILA|nr:unnamed protein product [Rotaria socialis]CAF4127595.1 unnamed protein product [Rotaria socialis]
MPTSSFPDQVKSSLNNICHLFTKCIQRYALHCSTDGHFAQLIFGADLVRAHRSLTNIHTSAGITQLLVNHFVSFEEQLGTNVKTLAFFIHTLCMDQTLMEMNICERRLLLSNIYKKLTSIEYPITKRNILEKKADINIELLIDHILDTLPRLIFDRQNFYHHLLCRLVKHNLDRIDDYLIYNQQLSFVTIGSSVKQSRLIDGILLPIHNSHKLLPSFISNSQLTILFLNIQSSEFDKSSLFTIVDHNQEFFSYDTLVYRQFVKKYLINVNLIISLSCINETFLFELHQANINVIDALDEQTFEFLLKVYQCLPCNRLLISEDESIDKISTILLDRHVVVDQQAYIYLSSNGSHQTLLTCVPTSTLILTTQKILINIVRLMKYILQQLNKTSFLSISTEKDYLKFIYDNIPELRHILDNRRIHIDKITKTNHDRLFPTCIFQEYLLNGINFLCYINKIDGIHSTMKKIVVEKCE